MPMLESISYVREKCARPVVAEKPLAAHDSRADTPRVDASSPMTRSWDNLQSDGWNTVFWVHLKSGKPRRACTRPLMSLM